MYCLFFLLQSTRCSGSTILLILLPTMLLLVIFAFRTEVNHELYTIIPWNKIFEKPNKSKGHLSRINLLLRQFMMELWSLIIVSGVVRWKCKLRMMKSETDHCPVILIVIVGHLVTNPGQLSPTMTKQQHNWMDFIEFV